MKLGRAAITGLTALLAECGATRIASAPSPAPREAPAAKSSTLPTPSTPAASSSAADAGSPDVDLARACLEKMGREYARQRVDFDHITSVRNVRIRLEVFGRVCAAEFPAWADAAARASQTGVAGRRRIFAELLDQECPAIARAQSGREIVQACPTFVGTVWDASTSFFVHVEPGVFAFATLLRKHGFDPAHGLDWLPDELALQSCFHPELDP